MIRGVVFVPQKRVGEIAGNAFFACSFITSVFRQSVVKYYR